jgi:protein-L-isoaspartate(D-aspartate) O-methyltransferase
LKIVSTGGSERFAVAVKFFGWVRRGYATVGRRRNVGKSQYRIRAVFGVIEGIETKRMPLPGTSAMSLQEMLREIDLEMEQTRFAHGKAHLDPRVRKALADTPRDKFVPEELKAQSWYNGPLPIGHGQTISQPYIVALMTELLEPEPTDVILEVGAGSGYQAAVLAHVVKQVYSIEIVAALADEARERLRGLGIQNVTVLSGDGYAGLPEHAPYDGIVVTAAAPHIPEPLVNQLKPGARLVIPVGMPHGFQDLLLVEKTADGGTAVRSILPVAFVPLTGDHGRSPVRR